VSYQLKNAIDEVYPSLRKIELTNREISKIAKRPSKRQRELESARAQRISGRDELLYKGEDLTRRPR
jgi:hypothetical protein